MTELGCSKDLFLGSGFSWIILQGSGKCSHGAGAGLQFVLQQRFEQDLGALQGWQGMAFGTGAEWSSAITPHIIVVVHASFLAKLNAWNNETTGSLYGMASLRKSKRRLLMTEDNPKSPGLDTPATRTRGARTRLAQNDDKVVQSN